MARPYQPSLLRLVHGGTALLVATSWCSGLLIYSQYDGRWGRLGWQLPGDWIDLHGSAGSALIPVALLLLGYGLSLGVRQLRRPSNALPLGALALALGSGLLMDGDALKNGQLQGAAYGLHLLAWLFLTLALLAHLAGALRRGGWPLISSMLSLRLQARDRPQHWPGQWGRWLGRCLSRGAPKP